MSLAVIVCSYITWSPHAYAVVWQSGMTTNGCYIVDTEGNIVGRKTDTTVGLTGDDPEHPPSDIKVKLFSIEEYHSSDTVWFFANSEGGPNYNNSIIRQIVYNLGQDEIMLYNDNISSSDICVIRDYYTKEYLGAVSASNVCSWLTKDKPWKEWYECCDRKDVSAPVITTNTYGFLIPTSYFLNSSAPKLSNDVIMGHAPEFIFGRLPQAVTLSSTSYCKTYNQSSFNLDATVAAT